MEKVDINLCYKKYNDEYILTENSVRHIDTIKEMEARKLDYQIRCSHYELEFVSEEKKITCIVCGKNWLFLEERGYSKIKSVYVAEKNLSINDN